MENVIKNGSQFAKIKEMYPCSNYLGPLATYKNYEHKFIDGLLFQCFEFLWACADFFTAKTLHFTHLSIKLLYSK